MNEDVTTPVLQPQKSADQCYNVIAVENPPKNSSLQCDVNQNNTRDVVSLYYTIKLLQYYRVVEK